MIDEPDLAMAEPREKRAGTSQDKAVHRTLARSDHEGAIGKEAGERRRPHDTDSLCPPEPTRKSRL